MQVNTTVNYISVWDDDAQTTVARNKKSQQENDKTQKHQNLMTRPLIPQNSTWSNIEKKTIEKSYL